ncbi:MAG: PDZ domain-containing protein, partial [Lentisphaeria bacterium]|nr:PDZ domain-containing protein [Lentisphaeria bacterium]
FGPVPPPDNYSWTTPIFPEIPKAGGNAGVVRYQYACFLAKRSYVNPFGVYFIRPEDIPGSRDTRVRIALVVPGSPAARQGIRPGDPVKRINGVLVTSYLHVLQYATGQRAIRTLEVYHE